MAKKGDVVVVFGTGRAHECVLPRCVDDGAEPEHVCVEVSMPFGVAYVQHGVVHAADHRCVLSLALITPPVG